MTNFEKFKLDIQNMAAEDFVEKYKKYLSCYECSYNQLNCTCVGRSCDEGKLKWLKSEVNDG